MRLFNALWGWDMPNFGCAGGSPKLASMPCCAEADLLPQNQLNLRLPQAELVTYQH